MQRSVTFDLILILESQKRTFCFIKALLSNFKSHENIEFL